MTIEEVMKLPNGTFLRVVNRQNGKNTNVGIKLENGIAFPNDGCFDTWDWLTDIDQEIDDDYIVVKNMYLVNEDCYDYLVENYKGEIL